MKFKEQVAVITGSGRGIGKRIAEKLAAEGASVVVSDIIEDSVHQTAEALRSSYGIETLPVVTDVQNPQAVDRLMDLSLKRFARIDVLVNNAGICPITKVEDITLEEWNRVMAVNLTGVFFSMRAAMPAMKRQQSGRILNLASIAGKMGGVAAGAHYSASKAGVICLTKVFAKLLAPHGVRVNAIAPGPVETDMVKDFPPEARKFLVDQSPLGRIADTDDIAEGALYLLSDAARHITGEVLDINGGLLMD